jgi:hypothetical protein
MMSVSAFCVGACEVVEGFLKKDLAATGIRIVIGGVVLGVLAISELCWTREGQADEVKKQLIDKLSSIEETNELYMKFETSLKAR